MPWSNQGGGPWGSGGGGKGPWGSGQQPSGGGSSPPDLEELLRRSQDKLRTVLPGGGLGGKGVFLLLIGALAVWGVSGFYRVDTNEYGVVLRFGAFNREAGPGLNYHLPYPIETVLTPQVTVVRQIHIGMRQVEDLRRQLRGVGLRRRRQPDGELVLQQSSDSRRTQHRAELSGRVDQSGGRAGHPGHARRCRSPRRRTGRRAPCPAAAAA